MYETIKRLYTKTGNAAVVEKAVKKGWITEDEGKRLYAIVAAIKVLTLDRVKHLAKCHIKDGYIDLGDKETLQDMHRAYKALGGNGHLDTAMAAVEKLPIRNEGR